MDKIELTEDELKAMLRDAFNAGCAFTVGSHKDFKQTHLNCTEFVNKYLEKILKEHCLEIANNGT